MNISSVEFYPEQTIGYELPSYGSSAPFLCSMYAAFGMNVTENLRHFTYGVCDLSRIVDDCIDFPERQTPASLGSLHLSLRQGTIPGMSPLIADRASLFMEALDSTQYMFASNLYDRSVIAAKLRAEPSDVQGYVEAIRNEAEVQSSVLFVSEDPIHDDWLIRKKYNSWLKDLVFSGYFIDSAVDLRTDYREQRTNVKPTFAQSLNILKAAIPYARSVIKQTPVKGLARLTSFTQSYVEEGMAINKQAKV